jgi:hypothetical protein
MTISAPLISIAPAAGFAPAKSVPSLSIAFIQKCAQK